MKLATWNVNGFRAVLKKGFLDYLNESDPDIICLQETKMQPGQADFDAPEYHEYWNSAVRKGYSGTAIFTKTEPMNVSFHFDTAGHDDEGRVITAEYPEFYLVTVYTPNSKDELLRLDYRMEWEDVFADYVSRLDARKPVVLCGDLNVAHQEIDLKNPKTNRRNAGFTDEERGKLTDLLARGFVDSFRYLYPDRIAAYTWWSYRRNARATNAGWRIDYFLVSERIKDSIQGVVIRDDVFGSDHCPVELYLDVDKIQKGVMGI